MIPMVNLLPGELHQSKRIELRSVIFQRPRARCPNSKNGDLV
jgi:hypothetical protein